MKALTFEDRLEIMVTTGRPFYKVQLKVVRENGNEVAPNNEDVGEIIVKGDTISRSYWELPEETKARFVDGWLHTHDLAVMNSQGYVTIVDRKDDMIITGGENVYSIEIEDVLYSHPHILEAAVIGLPDPIWGEKVTAIVVPKTGKDVTEPEIIDFCRGKLAPFKAPKRVFFTDSLPKTGSAKIYKYKLREIYKGK
jgi:acyl-CoA synthetase (AMP-forming)/AMP-acid ligase II